MNKLIFALMAVFSLIVTNDVNAQLCVLCEGSDGVSIRVERQLTSLGIDTQDKLRKKFSANVETFLLSGEYKRKLFSTQVKLGYSPKPLIHNQVLRIDYFSTVQAMANLHPTFGAPDFIVGIFAGAGIRADGGALQNYENGIKSTVVAGSFQWQIGVDVKIFDRVQIAAYLSNGVYWNDKTIDRYANGDQKDNNASFGVVAGYIFEY